VAARTSRAAGPTARLGGKPGRRSPRWMSTMSSGSSRLTARPTVSAFRSMPGPLVVVTPRAPPKAAPSAAPMPAISSSAWRVRTPNFLCLESSCKMSDAGVIGRTEEEGQLGRWAAAKSPQASATFPVTFV